MAKQSTADRERDQIVLELIQGIKKGDSDALAAFFEIYSDDIYNFPIRLFRFTEDEASEFYLYAFEHLRDGRKITSFQGKAKFTTWFYAVLRNLTIDFLRTQKDKKNFVHNRKFDGTGKLLDAVDADVGTREEGLAEGSLFHKFSESLAAQPINQRVLFKLAYAWYFELTVDEIEYLKDLKKTSEVEILKRVQKLKGIALERSNEVRDYEDKLTSNFQGISLIESKINAFFRENPEIERKREMWHENFFPQTMPSQIIDLIQSLMKRKKRQESLLTQQKRSLLSIRVPYKDLGEILNSTQGVLSVQLVRIVEKLSQSIGASFTD
ncbi:MAG TPA: sigma-70 family RNA polymerase sigma factor [Turneriella sp.]|nr:sigma-70 family RNA polymerase sigma factor [Turneriella sp.]